MALRLPLAAIQGYGTVLSHDGCTEEIQKAYGKSILENTERLQTMIENVLLLSELDLKETSMLKKEKVSLFEMAQMCVDEMQEYAAANDVTLTCEGEDREFLADPSMMQLVVYNLITNAIRYNKKGGKVQVTVSDVLEVKDTGVGMEQEQIAHIFDRFYKIHKDESRKKGGSGLGLAIVKDIIDLHDGEIQVESAPGVGTSFRVRV
ncbi:MAG: HAMP domain-containing histidine kinase [Lachnospiraceae bacterium]|nr:HAMP domain-containing histidine kinase [Lachnospiraceae bacterium]